MAVASVPNSQHATSTAAVAPEKKTRKPRAASEGMKISFSITDSKEIEKLTELAAHDRRTPDNYVSLLVFAHLTGRAPIGPVQEKAAGLV